VDKKIKRFITKIKPEARIHISGPAVLDIKKMNSYGQIEILFTIDEDTTVRKKEYDKKEEQESEVAGVPI